MADSSHDGYALHRAALRPLQPGATPRDLDLALTQAKESGEETFAQLLCQQGLAPLWDEKLESADQPPPISDSFKKLMHQNRLHATGQYLIHSHSLAKIKPILDDAGVDHVIIKGSHTRELYYDTPALRPAVDIDILVKPEDKINAIKAFQTQGFTFHGVAQNISHECSLIKGKTSFDLHWNILRPGRTRKPMVKELLGKRVDYGSHWGMSHGATLFMMLVHPVFTKYSTTPHASLVRLVDLVQLLHRYPDSTEEAATLLHASGLATAGWITLTWLHLLTGNPQAKALAARLAPGKLRQKYLHNWLAKNRSTTLLRKPLLVQLGFTLPAHDTLKDAVRATRQARRCTREADATLAMMEKQVS